MSRLLRSMRNYIHTLGGPRNMLDAGRGQPMALPLRPATPSMSSIVELHPRDIGSGRVGGNRSRSRPAGRTVAPRSGAPTGAAGSAGRGSSKERPSRSGSTATTTTEAEKRAGYALLCSVAPRGDLVVESTEASGVDDIAPQQVRARVTRVEPASDDHAVVHLKVQRARVLRYLSGQRATVQFENVSPCETWLASCPCDAVNLRITFAVTPGMRLRASCSTGCGAVPGRPSRGRPGASCSTTIRRAGSSSLPTTPDSRRSRA